MLFYVALVTLWTIESDDGRRVLVSVYWERWIGGIRLIAVCSFSTLAGVYTDDIDYKAYEQVVDATHRFNSIFYDSNE